MVSGKPELSQTFILGRNPKITGARESGTFSYSRKNDTYFSWTSEGYIEGFANIYNEIAQAIYATRKGKPFPQGVLFPDLDDGIAGMEFIDAALKSNQNNSEWVSLVGHE